MSVYHVTRAIDLPAILVEGLTPRIGPRSNELGEETPAVYLFPDLESVENALMNWLGECLEDDDIVILEIDPDGLALVPGADFELVTPEPIPASAFLGLFSEDLVRLPMTLSHPILSEARVELGRYLDASPIEKAVLEPLVNQLLTDQDPFARSNMTGHITASALILSPDGDQVLMIHHNIYDRLLNPGGHHEGSDSLRSAALREGAEETGVQGLEVHAWSQANARPFDIDTHAIAANPKKGEGDHFHHDFIYLFVADPAKPLVAQIEEVKAAGWFPTSSLAKSGDARLERLHDKLVDLDLTVAAARAPRP